MNHVPGGPDRGPEAAGPDAGANQDEAGDVDHVVEEGTQIGMHPEGTHRFLTNNSVLELDATFNGGLLTRRMKNRSAVRKSWLFFVFLIPKLISMFTYRWRS